MSEKKVRLLPLHLLLLDALGTGLLIIGLLELFMQIGLVPEIARIPAFEWIMIAVGVLLMMPLITHFVFNLKHNK